MSEPKPHNISEKLLSPAKLSFQIHSPLFRLDTMSPTFTISLSGVRGSFQAAKPADPDMSHSISPVPGTPRLPSKSPAITPAGLSPFSRAEDLPITSKSTELQNRMIDEQLELLGELFPKQVNHALQAKRSKAPGSPSGVEERTEKLSADETSDFHVSPVSEALALSSDWPKLPEASQSVVASQRASLISGEAVVDHSVEQSTKSPNLSPTADRPLIKRRSLAPTLRVNTVESQQYATKELKLIRKMKEEGRMKSDNKVSKSEPERVAAVRDLT